MTTQQPQKLRLASAWLGGCSGCHMSFLDLDETLITLLGKAELVYGPLVDAKQYPQKVDICLVEGAVSTRDHLELAQTIRHNSRQVISFGDCAVTGNLTSMRNRIPVAELLTRVYHEPLPAAADGSGLLPELLPQALPLHQVIKVDVYLPGCPPAPERIMAVLTALLAGRPVTLPPEMRSFG